MAQVAELYSDSGGFTASDPEHEGPFAWFHEAENETSAVLLLTIDQHILEQRSNLISEELDLAPTSFPCPSGHLLVCAFEDHPSNHPDPSHLQQALRVNLPPGQHSLRVLRLTWDPPPKPERLYPEDLLIGTAIAIIPKTAVAPLIWPPPRASRAFSEL
jgi:hypothetical protein